MGVTIKAWYLQLAVVSMQLEWAVLVEEPAPIKGFQCKVVMSAPALMAMNNRPDAFKDMFKEMHDKVEAEWKRVALQLVIAGEIPDDWLSDYKIELKEMKFPEHMTPLKVPSDPKMFAVIKNFDV